MCWQSQYCLTKLLNFTWNIITLYFLSHCLINFSSEGSDSPDHAWGFSLMTILFLVCFYCGLTIRKGCSSGNPIKFWHVILRGFRFASAGALGISIVLQQFYVTFSTWESLYRQYYHFGALGFDFSSPPHPQSDRRCPQCFPEQFPSPFYGWRHT